MNKNCGVFFLILKKNNRFYSLTKIRVATKGGRGTEEKLFTALLKLRQACCHPCIGSGGLGGGTSGGQRLGGGGLSGSSAVAAGRGGQGRLLTMDQVLDRYVDTFLSSQDIICF